MNVLKRALPGAIVVVLNTLVIFALTPILNIDKTQSSTLIVISATFTGFMVLLRVLRPYNGTRKLLFTVMFSLFVVAVIVFPDFFEFNSLWKDYYTSGTGVLVPRLPVDQFLLLLVLLQAAYPMMSIVAGIPGFIGQQIKNILMKLANI